MSYTISDHILVQVKNLSKSYGKIKVLNGVNFEIRDVRRFDPSITQGQVVSILGPSGVGKTTFFNVLAGLLEFEEGQVFIDNPATAPVEGLSTQDLIPTRRGLVGVVYQNYKLFDFKTVEDLLYEGIKNSNRNIGKDSMLNSVEEYLEWFGLFDHRMKFPFELSGGQKQRVAIAQQLLRAPQLLLMDEPFSGLDPETKNGVVTMIRELAKRDEYLTIIIISHDIHSSLKVSDTIYMMGRNRGSDNKVLPGASVLHDKTIDLKQLGLAWRDDTLVYAEFARMENEIEKLFSFLSGSV